MFSTTHLDGAIGLAVATSVPTSRSVSSLSVALGVVRRLGGSVTSEVRTAPGIGSWALVTDAEGNDLVLWENATPA
jgi:predicted enzyme related to lactoylglutathione lyase